ncbi:hypothetical protein J6590_093046 [Homalodisca vitripennis]|nr:hypothetical protein J6590_093046 [Homalodisca vitripennis]
MHTRLPSQASVYFLNRLPNLVKDAPTPNTLKTRLKRLLVSQTFYNAVGKPKLARAVTYGAQPTTDRPPGWFTSGWFILSSSTSTGYSKKPMCHLNLSNSM